MRDESSASFSGNAVEQARAIESHAQRRQAALAGRYVALVPASGFGFRNYDIGERRLVLDTEHSLVLGDGAELFVPSTDPAPGFVLAPGLADRLATQRIEGKLALRLIFRPLPSQLRKDACTWLGGGRVVKLEIEILGSALVASDGTVLSRGDTGEYADTSSVLSVRSPRVTIYKPRGADGKDVTVSMTAALGALAERALPCYENALIARPALRGSLVVGIRIGPGGQVEASRVEMSSLGDDALVSCVAAKVAKATVVGTSSGQRFSVPMNFASADDR
ncbi:MAG TPA: AgmX/PglI C-terminal domain-containing protein [Polyangia bacterium]